MSFCAASIPAKKPILEVLVDSLMIKVLFILLRNDDEFCRRERCELLLWKT